MKRRDLIILLIAAVVFGGTGCGASTTGGEVMTSTQEPEVIEEAETTEEAEIGEEPEASGELETTEETSLFDLWEYEGYIDECTKYALRQEFVDCDYDGDGQTDRVNRSWDGPSETAIYTIEFGNGDRLVTPVGWETGFPHVQSGDLDSDGFKEILVTLSYDTSTDPYGFGDMWLFHKDETGQYSEVELPLVPLENGGKGLSVEFDEPVDGKIRFTLKEAGLSMEEEVGEDYISSWWSSYGEDVPQMCVVFYADITDGATPVLRCYVSPIPRWALILGFNLNYNNGNYELGYVEIDEPDYWY